MKATSWFLLSVAAGVLAAAVGTFSARADAAPTSRHKENKCTQISIRAISKTPTRGSASWCSIPPTIRGQVGGDLNMAVQCLTQLNRLNEIDALLEDAVKVHKDNWRLLQAAATEYINIPHFGFIIAGQFRRGPHNGGGRLVNSIERDRVRALQLMVHAMPMAMKDNDHQEVARLLGTLAFLINRSYQESWRLQYLTDLSVLPDYEEGWGYGRGQTSGARSAPTENRSSTACRRPSRRPRTTASVGGGVCNRRPRWIPRG